MRDCLVQIGIELLALGVDWLEAVVAEKISQLFQNHAHPGVDRGLYSFSLRSGKTKLEIIDNRDEALEERAVGVFDRVFFLARGPLLEVIEIGLAAQSEITEAIEIGLQADKGIIAIVLSRLLGRDYGALLIR
jgi:hypothetical protein